MSEIKDNTTKELVMRALVHGYVRHMKGMPLESDDYTDEIAAEIDSRINKNVVIDWKKVDGTMVALIYRQKNAYEPYVVAWNYCTADGTWGQGHYFGNIVNAVRYYDEEY